jgi:dTDP-glucose 4,6-dehydratase
MKLLITGGLGFIGSHFIRHALRNWPEYKIVNFDKMTYAGNPDNLREIQGNPNYVFVKGDICDEKMVDEIISSQKPDAIINFAAETHVDRSIFDPQAFIRTDVLGTHNLLEAARKYNIPRYIQISTDEVYGSINNGSFSERSPLNPSSPYAASKAAADMVVKAYFTTYNMPVLITRSSNNYGPNQYPEKVIPLFATNIIEGKKIPLYGEGKNVRNWIYVLDNCEAINLVLQKGKEGEVYNIGGESEVSNIELTKSLLKFFEKDEGQIEFVKDRLGHDLRYSLDSTKIKSELGWNPRFEFEYGLYMSADWYKKNEWWWKSLKSGEYLEYYKKQYKER